MEYVYSATEMQIVVTGYFKTKLLLLFSAALQVLESMYYLKRNNRF